MDELTPKEREAFHAYMRDLEEQSRQALGGDEAGLLRDEQIEVAFEAALRFRPRPADVAVVKMLGGTVEVLAEYVWDHWLGEPTSPTPEALAERMREVLH